MIRRKYRQSDIVREMERYITENELAHGVRLPTGRELARRYDVSLKTVERAMARLAANGLITRIRGNGSFVLSSMRKLRKRRVAFFIWRFQSQDYDLAYAAHFYFQEQLKKILSVRGCNVDLILESDRKNLHLLETCLAKYDVILATAGVLDTAEAILRNSKVPVILILDDVIHYGPWHQIIYDYRPGFNAGLRHLLSCSARKFFVVAKHGVPTSARRVTAIQEEAALLGIPQNDIFVYYSTSDSPENILQYGQNAATYYLENHFQDYAIISTSDFLSCGMLDVFWKNGLVSGKDFLLLSYDNLESRIRKEEYQFGVTSITHPQDAELHAIASLLESLEKIPSCNEFYQTYFVPARELVIRKSTTSSY